MSPSRARAAAWGAVLAALYLAVASWSFKSGHVPVRPLFDGQAPAVPYRWVNKPAHVTGDAGPAEPGQGFIPLTKDGSDPVSVVTKDAQTSIIFQLNAFRPREGEKRINVEITPLDPATLGPPPEGMVFDGNAYELVATYDKSKAPAEVRQPATVLLRYAAAASDLARLEGGEWVPLDETTPQPATLQLFAEVTELGTFAPVGEPPVDAEPPPGTSTPWWVYAAGGVGAAGALAGLIRFRRRISSKGKPPTRLPPKRPTPGKGAPHKKPSGAKRPSTAKAKKKKA